MLVEPKIVYICNHVVDKTSNTAVCVPIVRSSNDLDVIDGINYITKVNSVYKTGAADTDNIVYCDDFDFTVENNKSIGEIIKPAITWVGNKPNTGDTYYLECIDLSRYIKEYDIDECPKCSGNGWYVSLFSGDTINIKKVSGMNKMVQDFIKIMFTQIDDSGYGSTMNELVGNSIHQNKSVENEILNIVRSCEIQMKQSQLSYINNGNDLSDSERLQSARVRLVEFDDSIQGFIVEILLKNETGNSAGLNLKV